MRGCLLGSLHLQKENQIEENCSPEALPVHKFESVPTTFTYIDKLQYAGSLKVELIRKLSLAAEVVVPD
jgi:hypothetical protein